MDVDIQSELTRGMTLADNRVPPRKPANVKVLLDVDREAFIGLIQEGIKKLDNTSK